MFSFAFCNSVHENLTAEIGLGKNNRILPVSHVESFTKISFDINDYPSKHRDKYFRTRCILEKSHLTLL